MVPAASSHCGRSFIYAAAVLKFAPHPPTASLGVNSAPVLSDPPAQLLDLGAGAAPSAEVVGDEDFGDLHHVERCTLAQIVADHPQIEAVRHGRVAADAADIDRVLA